MKKPTAIGANIFAGGFTLGVSKHFRVLGHLEHDNYGAQTAHQNLGVPVIIGKDEWLTGSGPKIDFVYSNPPCAIWSVAAAKKGGNDWRRDPRLQRIRDIFTLVDKYRPAVWCWESVCQAFNKGREFVEDLANQAAKRGYSATYLLIDAAYLGTPQHRKRFFLVLHNIEIPWAVPDFNSIIPAGKVLKKIRPDPALMSKPTPSELQMLKTAKPGERLAKVFNRTVKKPKIGSRGQMLGRPSFLKVRLDPSAPSSTVIGNSIFHPTEPRLLAANEVAALCGYPSTWKWPKSDAFNLIARGVMPPVGEWLARHVARGVRLGRPIRSPARWLVDFREAPGSIREVSALPEGVSLDWRPRELGEGQKHPVSLTRKAQAGPAGRRASGRSRPLDELAEATRRGIPDKNSQLLIRSALAALKKGKRPEGSGMLIRARLIEGRLTDHEIVAEVLRCYKGRRTTIADVSYHKGKLRRAGMLT